MLKLKRFLDRFILGIPRLYIKQFPYAWIFFIALWTWPPNIAWVFLLVVVLGLLLTAWHHAAWLATLRESHAPHNEIFYVDRPPIPWRMAVRNIAILAILAGILAVFLNSQIELQGWQMFAIVVGFFLFYRNSTFFGAPTTYVITSTGLAVYFAPTNLDYRLFLRFDEIERIDRCAYRKDTGWDCFARTRASDGLLLYPVNPAGLTRRIEKLFIVPGDIEKFLAQLPARLAG